MQPAIRPRLTAELISSLSQQQQVQKLYKLNCTSLNITKIELSIKKYTRIRCLVLDFNFIQKIQNISCLTDLRELHMQGNMLTKIQGLENAKNLTVLNLSSNKIERIEGISHLGKLEIVNLSKNNIGKISQLQSLKELKFLNMSYNRIMSLESLPAFSKLQTLLLNNNKIESILGQKLSSSTKLIRLDLSHNQLSECRFISKLSSIQSLNLSYNRLEKLQLEIPLKLLEQLNLQNNHLDQLPSIGEYFPELVVLNLSNNMFCSEHQFITMLSETQMLTDIQFINNPVHTHTFQLTLEKLFSFDRINKKLFHEPGAKYLKQINHIEEGFSLYIGLEDDQEDMKLKLSGFYNDELQSKMTGIKPHRALSPATKKAKFLISNDYNDIERNFKEFLQNDRRIRTLREKYESICLQNNIEKPKIQPLQQDNGNFYLTQEKVSSEKQIKSRESINELRLRNDTNEKLMKETIREKEEKWAQLKARTKERSFNIRKSRVKDMNGSLAKNALEPQKGKGQMQLMRTQIVSSKLKQKPLENPLKTGTIFYRPSSQK